ncbi:MAG: ATP-binding protein [Planctomycetaceae bacterium]|nr:ATP-binding protein [Planctomycetaceae bacterium]
MATEASENIAAQSHNQQLVEENRRLVQRCLELEAASRRQLEKLQAANAVLSRGEADLRILLENAAIGFALTDLGLRIATANKTFANMIGYSQAEMPGVNFANFVYVGKLPAFTRLTNHPAAGEAVIELVARDGALIPCRIAVSHWLDENGAPQGHFLLVYDAGPELIAAGRLKEMEQSLAELEKSRTLFLEVVSRELRTPASGVVGMARMLMDAGLDERQAELAGVIHSSAASLVRLVDDLVDAANLDNGPTRANAVAVDVGALVGGVANLFSVRVEEKGLEMRVHVASNVPPLIMADPHLLRRVLVHLVDNSVKFTERGHVSITVEVIASRLRFMVSDTGPGVPPDLEEQLFQAGLTADSPESRRFGGIGVGLAICRRLVHAMGGKISYESETGRGSEFHFSIPLLPAAPGTLPGKLEPPAEAMRLPPMDILLADANPLSSRVAQAYLRFDGHRLTTTDNGVDAAERCRTCRFDLVVLDLNLPKLDGMQTLRLIREDEKSSGRRTPVIFIASSGQMRDESYYRRAGADGVVKKPIQPVELMEAAAAATNVRPSSITRRKILRQYDASGGGSSIRRIDGNHLVNLRQIMPEDQFHGVLRFFMEDAVPGLVELQTLAERDRPDHQRIALAANKARGLAGYLGFTALAALLKQVEHAGRTDAEQRELVRLAGELPLVTDDTLEELKRIVPDAFATMSDMRGPIIEEPEATD